MTDKWECFCDAAYFDMWAVKEKGNMCFNDVVHVNTKEEAEYIVDTFNKVQRYREVLEAIVSEADGTDPNPQALANMAFFALKEIK